MIVIGQSVNRLWQIRYGGSTHFHRVHVIWMVLHRAKISLLREGYDVIVVFVGGSFVLVARIGVGVGAGDHDRVHHDRIASQTLIVAEDGQPDVDHYPCINEFRISVQIFLD